MCDGKVCIHWYTRFGFFECLLMVLQVCYRASAGCSGEIDGGSVCIFLCGPLSFTKSFSVGVFSIYLSVLGIVNTCLNLMTFPCTNVPLTSFDLSREGCLAILELGFFVGRGSGIMGVGIYWFW